MSADKAHPAGDGLMGSGRVVSLLSASTPMLVRADPSMALVFIEVPGRPCGALLGFTCGAAVRFAEQLRAGFGQLCGEDTAIDLPALSSFSTDLAALATALGQPPPRRIVAAPDGMAGS